MSDRRRLELTTAAQSTEAVLPEVAGVHWRRRVDERSLRSRKRLWTLTSAAHTVPFLMTAGALVAIEPMRRLGIAEV